METNSRITTDAAVMGGVPCVRGLRVTVSMVAGLMRGGYDDARVLDLYPYLEPADLDAVRSWTADLAAFADLLAWRAAGSERGVEVTADGCVRVSLWHHGGAREVRRGAPTVREAVRDALAAWGGG